MHQPSQKLFWSITEASREGDLERVKLPVDQWRVDGLFSASAADLRPALTGAVKESHSMIVSYLLDTGAKIDPEVILYGTYGTSVAVWPAFLDHGWDINSNCGTGAPVLK